MPLSHPYIGGELDGGEFIFHHDNLVGMDERIPGLPALGDEIFPGRNSDEEVTFAVTVDSRHNLLIGATPHRQRSLVGTRSAGGIVLTLGARAVTSGDDRAPDTT